MTKLLDHVNFIAGIPPIVLSGKLKHFIRKAGCNQTYYGYKSLLFLLSALTTALLCSCSNTPTETLAQNNMDFPKSLTELKLFEGSISELRPAHNVHILELSATLFTDYSEKQRLLKLPDGTKIIAHNDNLPEFPDQTILAKTFYYTEVQTGVKRKIIETRILIKNKTKWNVATYIWNKEQTNAYLSFDGAKVAVNIEGLHGKEREIKYQVPSGRDCVTCHSNFKELTPIGPKFRNLDISILVKGTNRSQIQYLKEKKLLTIKDKVARSTLPSYKDSRESLEKRARAYFEINCAHCHNPSGFAGGYGLDLRYESEYNTTGIYHNKWNIQHRMKIHDMPKLGTTVVDSEGLELITRYLATLK